MEQTKYDVFISYSREDYMNNGEIIPDNPISAILELFDKNGVSYWIDKKGVYGGQEFVEVISDAIIGSKMMVFVSSMHSNDSIYTAGEILEAIRNNKLVIPVRIDDCEYNKKFRLLLNPRNFLDYKTRSDNALSDLLLAVKNEKNRIEKEENGSHVEINELPVQGITQEVGGGTRPKTGKIKWLHMVYGLIVLILAAIICVRYCGDNKNRIPKKLDADSVLVVPVGSVKFTMIKIDGGKFLMGAQKSNNSGDNYDSEALKNESPVHRVTLDDYFMGETEVTQSLWLELMEDNPSNFEGLDHPVEGVSWNDICGMDGTGTDTNCFLYKLNKRTGKSFRLPTEAEWEYAARGGEKSLRYKYSGGDIIDDVAWYFKSADGSHPVKGKNPNELGLYDMSGNVWEWCMDRFDSYISSEQTNPTGSTKGSQRVLRGGSWLNKAKDCRVSSRGDYAPAYKDKGVGFRLVLPKQTSSESNKP